MSDLAVCVLFTSQKSFCMIWVGCRRFGRNWKEIVAFVGTRSVSQVKPYLLGQNFMLSGCSVWFQ